MKLVEYYTQKNNVLDSTLFLCSEKITHFCVRFMQLTRNSVKKCQILTLLSVEISTPFDHFNT